MRETFRVLVPKRFLRIWTYRVIKKRKKYEEIDRVLYSSRLPLTVQELLAMANFYSLLSALLGLIIGVVVVLLLPPEVIALAYSSANVTALQIPVNFSVLRVLYYITVITAFCVVIYKMTQYVILMFPFLIAKKRKSEIELYLPHAINMMYGMSVGGSPMYEIFKTIAESKHIFGELSKEFVILIEMIDVFKRDLYDAMKFVRDTTPSPKLAGFLDDLAFILKGGGKLSDFLKRKSEELAEERELVFQAFIEFIGLMAEVYISAFIVLPLFLLIVFVVMKLMGMGMFEMYRIMLLVMLPVATVMFIWLLRSMLPMPKISLEEFEKRFETIKANVVDEIKSSFTIDRRKLLINKIKRFLLHPFKKSLHEIELKIISFHLSVVSLIVFLVFYGFLKIEETLLLTISVFVIPLFVIVETKERIIRKMEEKIPNVFSELAMLNEAGLTVLEGLKILSGSEMGALTKEIAITRRELEWGILIPRAFVRLGLRVKSDVLSKVIPVVVKALETAPTIKDAFNVVSKYADSEVTFKKRIRSSMFLYIVIIYMCIAIFLLTSYMIIVNFFKPFSDLPVSTTGTGGITLSLNIDDVKNTFFQIAVVVGVLSGLVAGQIGEGNVLLGLKHSYVFLIISYVLFFFFI
jgi:flagellar protein FlaJ